MDKKTLPIIPIDIHHKIELYRQKLLEAKIPVEKLIVFGSRARGNASQDSDIDLCVISSSFQTDDFDTQVHLLLLRDHDTIEIEPHPMNPESLSDKWNPLAIEILKYGVIV